MGEIVPIEMGAICKRCGRSIRDHLVYFEEIAGPIESPPSQEAQFAFDSTGFYCPLGPEEAR